MNLKHSDYYKDTYLAVSNAFETFIYGKQPSEFRLKLTWWISGILRVFWGLLIIPFPLVGWFLSVISDVIDYGFANRAKIRFKYYQYVDKSLDIWFRVCCVIAAYYYQWDLANLFLSLVLFRLVGDISYSVTKKQISLVLFPNIIEIFFPAYIIFLALNWPQWAIYPIFILSLIIKIYHEYLLHYNKWVDPYSAVLLKKNQQLRPKGE